MPAQDLSIPPTLVQAAVGVDETLQDVELGEGFSDITGLFPALHEIAAIREPAEIPGQGTIQRIFGKKLVDANPLQKVYAIAQAYNGFGQYGYYVQTDQKLYFHQCETPKDLHINFATLQSLGTDDNNNSLDIFGHQKLTNQLPPDTSISCVFDYPSADKPPLNDAGHPGVDFIVIAVAPVTPTTDNRLRSRLQSVNSGTAYDGFDIGYYVTQNACRQDSLPLVVGTDGDYGYPPSNVKLAYLGWGGDVLVNTWTPFTPTPAVPAKPNIWTQISAPVKTQYYPDNYVYQTISGSPPAASDEGTIGLGGLIVGKRYFFSGNNTLWYCYGQGTVHYHGAPQTRFLLSFVFPVNYNTLNPSAANGTYAISGNIIYYREAGAWIKPYSSSWTPDWTWANEPARLAQATVPTSLGKRGHQSDTDTYWRLDQVAVAAVPSPTVVTWTYANATDRISAVGFAAADIGKIAFQTDAGTYWVLADFNRHASKTFLYEFYCINLNRLFTDNQTITPASIQFLIKAYWDKNHSGAGDVNIAVVSYKGGLITRTDKVSWEVFGGVLKAQTTSTKNCSLLASGDVKGKNLAIVTVTMADGALNITTPSVNTDGNTPCPF